MRQENIDKLASIGKSNINWLERLLADPINQPTTLLDLSWPQMKLVNEVMVDETGCAIEYMSTPLHGAKVGPWQIKRNDPEALALVQDRRQAAEAIRNLAPDESVTLDGLRPLAVQLAYEMLRDDKDRHLLLDGATVRAFANRDFRDIARRQLERARRATAAAEKQAENLRQRAAAAERKERQQARRTSLLDRLKRMGVGGELDCSDYKTSTLAVTVAAANRAHGGSPYLVETGGIVRAEAAKPKAPRLLDTVLALKPGARMSVQMLPSSAVNVVAQANRAKTGARYSWTYQEGVVVIAARAATVAGRRPPDTPRASAAAQIAALAVGETVALPGFKPAYIRVAACNTGKELGRRYRTQCVDGTPQVTRVEAGEQ